MSAMRPPGKLNGLLLGLESGRGPTIIAPGADSLPLIESVDSPQPRLAAPPPGRIAGIADEDRMP